MAVKAETMYGVFRVKGLYEDGDVTEIHLYKDMEDWISARDFFNDEWEGEAIWFPVKYIIKENGVVQILPNKQKHNNGG